MAIEKEEKIVAVADSSFLIGLCMISQFQLLERTTDQLLIAPSVWREVVEKGEQRPGVHELKNSEIILRQSPKEKEHVEILKAFLDVGEAEALVLAQETNCTVFFVDEIRARKAASNAGIHVMGLLGFLLAAKQSGFIDMLRPLIDRLMNNGFRLSQNLIDSILREAKEL